MSISPSRGVESNVSADRPSLLNPEERAQLAARRRIGKLFLVLTIVPIVLAVLLILALFGSVLLQAVSWQVVEPRNSGQTFSFREARSWEGVVRLELLAQGLSTQEIEALLGDPEELRKFRARNRVELMLRANGEPLRWVVTNIRDDIQENYGLIEHWGREQDTLAALIEGQNLYLNPWMDFSFLLRNNSGRPTVAGLSSALVGTLWVIGMVILLSLPIGVGTAIYLEEYAPDNRWTRILEVNLRNLAGVPSIVYGILGLYVFVRTAGFGPSVIAAACTLSLLILPVVVIAAREAIRAVPGSLREASYGLGATKWQTVSRVVLPNAVTGIVTGVILAVARAIGETAPLLMVGGAGFVNKIPDGLLSNYSVIPTQIYSWVNAPQRAFDNVASAGIVTLLGVLILLYVLANIVRRRYERKW